MRCTHYDAQYNIIPRTMYYQVSELNSSVIYPMSETTSLLCCSFIVLLQSLLSRNHPSTGQTYTITLTGGYLRFWIFDAFAYSSSRLFDLKDRQHSRQVVDLIAYLLSPSRTGPEGGYLTINRSRP
jgi:hypothetical protein